MDSAAPSCALASGVEKLSMRGVGVVAQLADRRAAVAGQHVEGVGAILAAGSFKLAGVGDEVLQAVEGLVKRDAGARCSRSPWRASGSR